MRTQSSHRITYAEILAHETNAALREQHAGLWDLAHKTPRATAKPYAGMLRTVEAEINKRQTEGRWS